ncbi:hypothetical protein MSPP1_002040 [Malassezia sp. CBS 17886]|nr:hypothetical protein MSPP1_002040 [Malassezia sp. CBS 17886]
MRESQRVEVPREACLLASACNPCMDLVALLCRDSVSPVAAVGPPGLTPAQLAMRQRMLAFQARRMGVANPAAPGPGAAAVRRGAAMKLVLMRHGQSMTQVWEVPVAPPEDVFPAPPPQGTTHELASVPQICWSPDGARIALRLCLSRETVGAASDAGGARHVACLHVYSVYNGDLVHARTAPTHVAAAEAACSMQWVRMDVDPLPLQSLSMLQRLAPLPPLDDALRHAAPAAGPGLSARGAGGRHTQDACPSRAIREGRGALAGIPALWQLPEEMHWLADSRSSRPRASDVHEGDSATHARHPYTLLFILDPRAELHVFLDGTIHLGTVPVGAAVGGRCPDSSALVAGDAAHATVLLADGARAAGSSAPAASAQALASVTLPLASVTLPLASSRLYAVQTLAEVGTALQFQLAHASDAAHFAAQQWVDVVRPRACEWHEHIDRVARQYGVDVGMELMTLCVAGRISPATEQLLLHSLTEGTTIAMEKDAKTGLKWIRRLAGTVLVPAAERILILLTELQGCAQWGDRFHALLPPASTAALDALVRDVQVCHAVGLALQEQAERELLALDELFKWWRMEQDRQERRKVEQEPVVAVPCHDTLTVLEQLQRGFIAPELDGILGLPQSPAPPPADDDESSEDVRDAPRFVDDLQPLYEVGAGESADPQAAVGDGDHSRTSPPHGPEGSAPSPPMSPPPPAASVAATMAWLDSRTPRSDSPTSAQVAGIHATPQLFAGPAHAFREPRALPGDPRTLADQLRDASAGVARVLGGGLARAMEDATVSRTAAIVLPRDARRRADGVVSVAADAPERAETQTPLLVRSLAAGPVHYVVCADGDRGGADGGTVSDTREPDEGTRPLPSRASHLYVLRTKRDGASPVSAARIPLDAPAVDFGFLSTHELLVVTGDRHTRALRVVDIAGTEFASLADGQPLSSLEVTRPPTSIYVYPDADTSETMPGQLATARRNKSALTLAENAHTLVGWA